MENSEQYGYVRVEAVYFNEVEARNRAAEENAKVKPFCWRDSSGATVCEPDKWWVEDHDVRGYRNR